MRYTEFMKRRIDGKEKGLPVRLMHKSSLKSFCGEIGVNQPTELGRFETSAEISLGQFPDRFVLKPAFASTAEGVMLLERTNNGYYDTMTKEVWQEESIKHLQRDIFEKYSRVKNRVTIVEQRIVCSEGLSIPADYKFLSFQGKVAVIIRIDRTAGRLKLSYFDGNFSPIVDDRIRFNDDIADREWRLPPTDWRALLDLARRVSVAVPTPCARVDLFSDVSGPLLGEITLTPGSFYYSAGHTLSRQEDERLGQMWLDSARRLGQ